METHRYLIVNADDFGQSPAVNRGISEAHRRGIVTSASLVTRGLAAEDAAAYSARHPGFSLGLHVDLGEWTFRGGQWVPVYEVVPLDDLQSITREAAQQLAEFRRLIGRDPSHLDSHQHVHRREPVRSILLALSDDLQIPLRHFSSNVRYCGDFYGQTHDGSPIPDAISTPGLIAVLEAIPEGITELACHPGYGEDLPNAMYHHEREKEVRVLCDQRIRATLTDQGITLCAFHDLAAILERH